MFLQIGLFQSGFSPFPNVLCPVRGLIFLLRVVSRPCARRIVPGEGEGCFAEWRLQNNRKIMIFKKNIYFIQILALFFQGDFSVPDVPKSMAWCENSICVGFKRDYYLIRVKPYYFANIISLSWER